MTNIAFIPVRGDSKSIPLKNIKPLMMKPLVYWTAKAANDSAIIDKVIIATDSEKIKQTVLSFNLPKVEVYDRDPQNAQDTSPTAAVVLEYLNKVHYENDDLFFLLQATSPLTETEHITGIYEKMMAENAQSALTCVREKRFYWTEDGHPINYDYMNRPRRQNFAGTLVENGAIYLTTVKNIKEHEGIILCEKVSVYEMPPYTAVEIDEPDDWLILEALMFKYKTPTPPTN
ncbi:MAG: acylneuraminate cytidylyltransferase family protein [Alphaproteobacteria bacterium]|nr:acylneuraminate cytidylyltransferase family protein [Alphaproteobacteria bacterium]